MKFSINSYRQIVREIIYLNDEPKKLSLSFAVGVFISVSPFLGIHTILAITLSILFKLNKLSTIAGSWINMPWTMPFIYYTEYKIGTFLLNKDFNFDIRPFTLHHYLKESPGAFLSIFIGSIIIGLLLGIIFYFLLKYIIEIYRRKKNVSTKG